ncbi:sulfotransferase family 2 domain-containing protein [Oceanibium sediminis]|uniref:sulfotransferase family 2 domain-containing protein n=1 Tax=Oceanibium sediminis TaxID=2026339 RepID=UPI0013001916|nr:sulfotransferase family 2 domain-containing protein [Oceanibium sediminis]
MVLVSHRHKFIYLKTKKTASTSVEAFFEPYCLDEPLAEVAEYRDEHIGTAGIVGARRGRAKRAEATWHAHMSAWDAFRALGPRRWFSYFKFTTIRNPFEKAVSEFHYVHRKDTGLLSSPLDTRRAAFETWLRTKRPLTDRYIYAIAGKPVVQDVIRFERLSADIARVAKHLHLGAEGRAVPRFKSGGNSPKEPYQAYYSDATRALVAKAYAPEIARYGYRFEPEGVRHGAG